MRSWIRTACRSIRNAPIPIAGRILRKGFRGAGQKWMGANWGVALPDLARYLRHRAQT